MNENEKRSPEEFRLIAFLVFVIALINASFPLARNDRNFTPLCHSILTN